MMYNLNCGIIELQVATNYKFFKMKKINYEECEYCAEIEIVTHAFLTCERTVVFWRDLTIWLHKLGYHNSRLEKATIILGDYENDKLFNRSILVGKK